MRIVITVAQNWVLCFLNDPLQIFVIGLLELSNGCILLQHLDNTGLQFLLCSVFLAFGGLCVALQTNSAASAVSKKMYIPGKCIQAMFGFVVAYIVQYCTFETNDRVDMPQLFIPVLLILAAFYFYSLGKSKKMWHFIRH